MLCRQPETGVRAMYTERYECHRFQRVPQTVLADLLSVVRLECPAIPQARHQDNEHAQIL